MTKENDDVAKDFLIGCGTAVFALPIIMGLTIIATVLDGWILTYLWQWFIVKYYPDVPLLNVAFAIGLCLIAKIVMPVSVKVTKNTTETIDWIAVFVWSVHPFMIFFIGWIVHTYFV